MQIYSATGSFLGAIQQKCKPTPLTLDLWSTLVLPVSYIQIIAQKGAVSMSILLKTFAFSMLIFLAGPIQAHPGGTAKDGCHYCRTNCAKWGVPKDVRHCHYAPTEASPLVHRRPQEALEFEEPDFASVEPTSTK